MYATLVIANTKNRESLLSVSLLPTLKAVVEARPRRARRAAGGARADRGTDYRIPYHVPSAHELRVMP